MEEDHIDYLHYLHECFANNKISKLEIKFDAEKRLVSYYVTWFEPIKYITIEAKISDKGAQFNECIK